MHDYLLLTNQQIANLYNGGQGTEVAAPANLAETGTATLSGGAVHGHDGRRARGFHHLAHPRGPQRHDDPWPS